MYFNFLLIKSRRVAFEQRLRNLEEKIRKSYQNDEATYKILKEQVEKLEEALSNQKQARQLVSQRNDKELKVIETNLNIQNNVDRQSKREAENELLGNFDGKLNSLRADMISDKRENDGKMASLLGNISDELSMIQGELYAERKSREENYDSVIKKLGNWVLKLDTMVNNEKRIREESHSMIFRMLEEMSDGLSTAIKKEGKLRQQNQEFLFNLLDTTVSKIQESI